MIKPTVGRVVLFHPDPYKIHAAIVACVHSDKLVNLAVFNENGAAYAATSVMLVQPEDEVAPGSYYCEWMPYQKAVASGAQAATLHPGQDAEKAAAQ